MAKKIKPVMPMKKKGKMGRKAAMPVKMPMPTAPTPTTKRIFGN
jgi:hypothetical protein